MKRIIRILILLLISITFMEVVQANNITIYPIEDTYIDSLYPNDNFVGDTSLDISKMNPSIPDRQRIGLLKFDLSLIPPDSIMTSAKLRLKSYIVSSPTPHIGVYKYSNNNWEPTTVTWDNFPTGSNEYLSELGIPFQDKYYFWNVLPAVINNNNDMLTLKLESTRTSSGVEIAYFSSLNSYDQEDRPILIINYSTSPSILVKTPNKGENWLRGSTKKIKWISIGDTGSNVKIELLKDGLVNEVIASSTPNDGSFSWNISATHSLGSDYKISIESTTNSSYKDVSNKNFIISTINCGPIV